MNRRDVLVGGVAGVLFGLSGCLDRTPVAANEYGYATLETNGVAVPLAPVDDVIDWYDAGEALFLDTRTERAFEAERIRGAAFSPAPDGLGESDPLSEVGSDTKVVTYCVCPHTLATQRGSSAIRQGYVHTYALDEGLRGWTAAGYPSEGSQVDA